MIHINIDINTDSENCISGTPKVSKYIANMVGLIVPKKYGINFTNTKDPQKI